MANLTHLHRFLCRHRRSINSIPNGFPCDRYANGLVSSPHLLLVHPSFSGKRWLSTNANTATPPDFSEMSAYDILGVSQTSTLAEIKASFRKLAKETHPDLARSQNHSSYASKKFIQILAAYEIVCHGDSLTEIITQIETQILSDSTRRSHYDRHISSQTKPVERRSKRDTVIFNYTSHGHLPKQMEVVEWLKWYRYAVNNIISERRVVDGSGYFDTLERDFYSAVHAAYYGPEIQSTDLLPDCFEAEERSILSTSEVLHLVSGRDLFGMVCLPNKKPQIPHAYTEKLLSPALNSIPLTDKDCKSSDSYRDLELHVSGRVIAVATRIRPKSLDADEDEDSQDQINVYLTPVGSRIHLGVIKGLGTTSEEGTCYVFDETGMKTHMIMKHRTLLVKHLHWFRIGEKISVCECRCTRARLPPSKFWLFEPRSAMHDIGGWYVEMFGRDNKGKTVPSQRYWDSLDTDSHCEKKLHPAMYLLALSYRTLDIEVLRRSKKTIKDKVEAKMSRVLSWRKKVT